MREHVQIDPAVKHPEHARPVPVRRRQAAQGQLDAGEDRLLPAAGELLLHLRHQLDERRAGRLDAAAAQRRGQQRQRAGVAVDGVHELLDLLARGIGGSAGVRRRRAFSTRSTSFTASSRSSWCSSRRCRSASNGAGSASRLVKTSRVSPFALSRAQSLRIASSSRRASSESASGVSEEGRQEDALHVVHHQQRGLLGERALDGQDGLFQVVERGGGVVRPTSWRPRASSTAAALLCVSTETNAARRIWCERTIQRANSAASAVLPSPPWPRTTA